MMQEQLELERLVERERREVDDSGGGSDEISSTSDNVPPNEFTFIRQCPYLGLILATISSLFFSLCSLIVKSMVDMDPMELAFCRFIGVLMPAIPIVIYRQETIFPRGRRLMLLLRSFVGTTGLMLSFYAFRHMPLGDSSVIVFSVPVFVAIFARIFLNERCGWFNVITIVLSLIGVVLITKPSFLFNNYETTDDNSRQEKLWGAGAALLATLFGANVYVLLRALKGLHFSVIMTNFGIYGVLQTFFVTLFFGKLCIPPCGLNRMLIVALALFSFSGQILLTVSLQLEQAGPVAIARSADIVFAFIWQIMFFHDIPSLYTIVGAVLVTSSVILTGLRKWVISLPEDSEVRNTLHFLTR